MIEDFLPFFCLLFVSNLMAPGSNPTTPEMIHKLQNASVRVNLTNLRAQLETSLVAPSTVIKLERMADKKESQESVEASTYPTNQDDGAAKVELSTYPANRLPPFREEVEASTYPSDEVPPIPEEVEASTYPSS